MSSIIALMIIINSCQQNQNPVKQISKKETLVAPVQKPVSQSSNPAPKLISSNKGIIKGAPKNSPVQVTPKHEKIADQPLATAQTVYASLEEDKTWMKEKKDGYTGPGEREEFEFNRVKDPKTGRVPGDRLLIAKEITQQSKNILLPSAARTNALSWQERGPIFDFVGPSNGNSRGILVGQAPNTYTSGRIRAVLVDQSDVTGNTVFVGGVDGGLWKCTNFLSTDPPNWTIISDFFSNMAISSIAQNPTNPDIMYFSTGEPTSNADRVLGNGIWKSTNHGVTWTLLGSTSTFTQTFKILVDNNHNVYAALRGLGVQRSNDGGTTWSVITPPGTGASCTDIELSSTGVLHASFGYFTSGGTALYRYTTSPATATSADWNTPVGLPTTGFNRIELATRGNLIYGVPTNTSNQVVSTYRSDDGGANWIKNNLVDYPAAINVTNGQGWYNLAFEINPLNGAQFLVGGLDAYLTTDSGKTLVLKTNWVQAPPYVHADHHTYKWSADGLRIMMATDGGMAVSKDGGATFADRNQNLGIKQFYGVAIHPTTTNHFLGGTQDNGSHLLTNPGNSSSVEVTGGDGALSAIDQDQPQFQFTTYVYNRYRRSTNGGSTWSQVNFTSGGDKGMFINPWDYDNNNNAIYAAWTAGNYFRWPDPATSGSGTAVAHASIVGTISMVTVSPYTAHQIYLGTNSGSLLKVSSANTATPTVTSIKDGAMPAAGYVSSIKTGTSDENLIMSFSNYGVLNVWVSTNGGTSWTAIDGNLPDMPVRSVMFYPGSNSKAIIATETGVWETDNINGGSTVWTANSTFPLVRTDMLEFRPFDGTIAAATHGRGIWTAVIPIPVTTWTGVTSTDWTVASNWNNGVPTAGTNTFIPSGVPNNPVINTVQDVYNLTVNSGAIITINSSGNLQIGSLLSHNGTITGSGITTLMKGGVGPVTGTGITSNLSLPSGATITAGAGNMQSITGVLNVGGTLTTNSNITLKSSAAGTASLAPLTGGSVSGSMTVERFNSDRRKWRLLGIPIASSSQTIKQAWQEGATLLVQNNNPGYGTHITTFVGDPNVANFDAPRPASSIRIYASDNFNSDAAHTPNTTSNIASNQAYFLFVRGDRSTDRTIAGAPSSSTTLRTNGTIHTGNVTKGVTGTAFSLIPNPYPSTINFDAVKAIAANSGINTFYVWDATLGGTNGVGQYRTIAITGTAPNFIYRATPGNFNDNWRFIESGTAFFIPGGSTVEFTEATKSSSTPPSSMLRTAGPTETELSVNLHSVNGDNSLSLYDGITLVFDNKYSTGIDKNDAKKITGFDLNFGVVNNNDVLSIESRPLPVKDDIIALKLWNSNPGKYQFEVQAANFPSTALFAYLKDSYLDTHTPLNLTGDTRVDFTITSDAGSTANNRFSIVFTKTAITPAKNTIVVYPNPVQNGIVTLRLNDMPKGTYGVKLLNSLGQTVITRQIEHAGGNSTQTIGVNKTKGTYMLEVIKPDNTKQINKVVIN